MSAYQTKQTSQGKVTTGFTIIEVVLVLAIAGLIFLIVFLALPGLQRSRRDTQRKSDANRMVAALINYQSNTGSFPNAVLVLGKDVFGASCTPSTDCLMKSPDEWNDPSTGSPYQEVTGGELTAIPPTLALGHVIIGDGIKCTDSPTGGVNTYWVAATGVAAVVMPLESGGYYCKDTGS